MSKSKKESKKKSININKILKPLSFLRWRAWYSTIFFFVALLVVSVWVWWNCFYRPQPSSQVIIEIQGSQKDYDTMKTGIENTMETLKERQNRFNNSPSFSFQRELFLDPGQQGDLPEAELTEPVESAGTTELVEPIESIKPAEPVGNQDVLENSENNSQEEVVDKVIK